MASVSDILKKPKSKDKKDDKDDKKSPKTNALLTFIAKSKKGGSVQADEDEDED